MTPVADWGITVVETDVDRAVIDQLQLWMPTYLVQAERDRNLASGFLVRPRNEAYQNVLVDSTFPDALLPAVTVTTAQTEGEPEPISVGVDIAYSADWRVIVSVVGRGRTPWETREYVAVSGGCVRAILTQQQLPVTEGTVHWVGTRIAPFSDDDDGRFLAASINQFTVHIDQTLTGDGPLAPLPDDPPYPPPDPDDPDQTWDDLALVGKVTTDIYPWGQAPQPEPTDS